MNGDEDLGEDITMKGNKFHFNQALAQGDVVPYAKQIAEGPAPAAPFKADWEGYTFPDKMHTLDPKAAKTNTAVKPTSSNIGMTARDFKQRAYFST